MSSVKTLTATEFKAKCLRILDGLEPQGIIITKHSEPIARVLPVRSARFDELYGCMKDKIKIKGEIFSTGVKWNAQSGKC
jgi:prevent-host-death family protein